MISSLHYILRSLLFVAITMSTTYLDTIQAAEVEFLQPQYIAMQAHDIYGYNDPYLYPRDSEVRYGGAFITNFHLVDYGKFSVFSDNKLSFEQSERTGKVIHGGWEFQIGTGYAITAHQAIELGRSHYSYHNFENTSPFHLPTKDSYYLNMIIYQK